MIITIIFYIIGHYIFPVSKVTTLDVILDLDIILHIDALSTIK